jgi:sulfatase modifying factor 1
MRGSGSGLCTVLLTVIGLTLSVVMTTSARAAGDRWALLIGVERYQREEVAPLRCSAGDVKGIARALEEACGFPADHIFILTSDATPDALPTRANITFRLDWLAGKVQPGDMFLFYFSGHGMLREGRSYLLTVESDARTAATLEDTAYPVGRLQQLLDRVAAGQKLSFVDACRNDPAASRADASNLLTEEFARSVAVRARGGAGAAESEGVATFYACKPGQRAYEWPGKGRGFFSYFLEQGLRGAAADAAGRVTLDGLEAYLAAQVPEASQREIGSRQEPWVERAGSNVGDLVLAQGQPRAPQTAIRELPTTATLRVTSEPAGATVTVDGAPSGTTPCDITVPLGAAVEKRVTVTVEKEGSAARKAEVTLYPGQVSEWADVKLEPLPAPLRPVVPPRAPSPAAPPGHAVKGQVWVSPVDGAEMVYVPAGEFLMGTDGAWGSTANEKPQHRVYLDAYWIDEMEVTVAQYRRFCQATGRVMLPAPSWGWQDDHPIVNVTWEEAAAYAAWAGKRLPTEAEWEKTARGTDGRDYPWGNEWDPRKCVHGHRSTLAVGSRPAGASPYGALDMAGNVWEWCADWYDRTYYRSAPKQNPQGPSSGRDRVLRGGAWRDSMADPSDCRGANRFYCDPGVRDGTFGFRCVRGAG